MAERQQGEDAALAVVVGPHDNQEVFHRHHEDERPEHQRKDPEDAFGAVRRAAGAQGTRAWCRAGSCRCRQTPRRARPNSGPAGPCDPEKFLPVNSCAGDIQRDPRCVHEVFRGLRRWGRARIGPRRRIPLRGCANRGQSPQKKHHSRHELSVASRQDLPGHPLPQGGRNREDHDQPAGEAQCLPAADGDGDARCLHRCARGPERGRGAAHRGRPAYRRQICLLRRRRSKRARPRRLRGRGRRAAPQRPRPATAHPLDAQGRHRAGGRVCDRWRAGAAPGVRPHDRGEQRRLRAGGPEDGEL